MENPEEMLDEIEETDKDLNDADDEVESDHSEL
jgi:hypothetical protein